MKAAAILENEFTPIVVRRQEVAALPASQPR
jgi:hypothetical protein